MKWTIETYAMELTYTTGEYEGVKFVGVGIRLRRDNETIDIRLKPKHHGLDPSVASFEDNFAVVIGKATKVACLLNSVEANPDETVYLPSAWVVD